MAAPLTTHTCVLTPPQADALEAWLREHQWRFRDVPYARFAADGDRVNVTFYTSRKLVVQGRNTREFVEFVLEPQILHEARLGYEDLLDPSRLAPRLGIDESGKGDFFGPLVVAGAYINESVVRAWSDTGVRDSKTIGSDRQIAELARKIRETPGCIATVVPIGNAAYNRLHAKLGSVNKILAWGHARAIENLLLQRHRMNPPPVRAISDQFAARTDTVARALMSLGRDLELVQRHRAEADLAVAAASILARDEFVRRLRELERQFGLQFPKGAAAAVDAAAREFLKHHGADRLPEVAKMHFRTALRAQGLPEPPRTVWRRPKPPE
ncbi:MAG TPA: ribonuclease HIII [Verrucomicrobiota bacterium]|nr:ribonuclease HIII [Verrucomicrobiota bacterium]HNU49700.1 ribonuclease HIII [Verrucomicrobiota bacterium]